MSAPDSRREAVRDRLRDAKLARDRADEEKAGATEQLVDALREALAAGISHSEAARLAGLTRNGAYHLLRQPNPKETP